MGKKVDTGEGRGPPQEPPDDGWLDRIMPRDGPPMSEHLAREIEQAFEHGPLAPGESVDGCDCGKCRIPDLPPYITLPEPPDEDAA